MKYTKKTLWCIVTIAILSSCGDQGNRSLEYQYIIEPDVVVTTFNDDIMLGNIVAVDIDNRGFCYALDGDKAEIVIFDVQGNYLDTFSGRGEGPGELLNPATLAIDQETNEIYVVDIGSGIKVFAQDGTYLGNFSTVTQSPPLNFHVCSGRIVGLKTLRDMVSAPPTYQLVISEYDENLDMIRAPLYSAEYQLDYERMGRMMSEILFSVTYDVSKENRIFYALTSPSDNTVYGVSEDGTLFFQSDVEYCQVSRSPNEISLEAEYIDSYVAQINRPNLNTEYDPIEDARQILSVGYDDDRLLWVLRGTSSSPLLFDVIDIQNNTLLYTIAIDEFDLEDDILKISYKNGKMIIYSLTPYSTQNIYIYNMCIVGNA